MIYLIALIPLALIITIVGMRKDIKEYVISSRRKKGGHHAKGTILVLEDGPHHYR